MQEEDFFFKREAVTVLLVISNSIELLIQGEENLPK